MLFSCIATIGCGLLLLMFHCLYVCVLDTLMSSAKVVELAWVQVTMLQMGVQLHIDAT